MVSDLLTIRIKKDNFGNEKCKILWTFTLSLYIYIYIYIYITFISLCYLFIFLFNGQYIILFNGLNLNGTIFLYYIFMR